jgi:hypothetical protein
MVPTILVNLVIELNLINYHTAQRVPNQCDNEVPHAAVITSCKNWFVERTLSNALML